MMLIWGSKSESLNLGTVETKKCETCEKERPFNLFLQYQSEHVFYLFTWVTQKEYLLLCDICHRGDTLDSKKVEPLLETNPIPFEKQYGWTFSVVIIVIAILYGMYDDYTKNTNTSTFLNNPKINDCYVIDASKIIENEEQSPLYTIMRIKKLNSDSIEFMLTTTYYKTISGINEDINNGTANNDAYYDSDTVTIVLAEVKFLQDNQIIKHIYRK